MCPVTGERLVLMSRRHCHLCENVREQLAELLPSRALTLQEFDVDEDPVLRRTYGERVPVLLCGTEILGAGRFDPLLAVARWPSQRSE